MGDKKNNGWVKITLFSILIILVFSYFACSYFLNIDCPFIGGPKYLMVEDKHIELPINKNFSSLDLFFTEQVLLGKKHKILIQKNGEEDKVLDNSKYMIFSSPDKKVIKIKLNEQSDSTLFIEIDFADVISGGFPKKRFIKNIDIDRHDINLWKFYSTYIDKRTNLSHYKSLDIRNLSNFLAINSGTGISLIDLYILISIFTIQLFLLFVTDFYSFIKHRSVKIGKNAIIPIKYIDMIAKDFAVTLGFFGSVVSIWTALEISEINYSDFLKILEMVKIAVFTTVLGLATRITYEIREFLYKLTETDSKQ